MFGWTIEWQYFGKKRIKELEEQLRRCKEDRIRLSNELANLRARVRKAVEE